MGFIVSCLGGCFFDELGQVLLSCFGFDHIGFVAGGEDEVAFVLFTVEVEAFYIMAGVS